MLHTINTHTERPICIFGADRIVYISIYIYDVLFKEIPNYVFAFHFFLLLFFFLFFQFFWKPLFFIIIYYIIILIFTVYMRTNSCIYLYLYLLKNSTSKKKKKLHPD